MVEPTRDNASIIQQAETLKCEGNELFRTGAYLESIKKYSKIPLYINGLVSKNDSMSQYSKNIITDEQVNIVNELRHTANANMAAAYLALKNYSKVIEKSRLALEVRESSKVLYRRGLAFIETGDIDNATLDLERAHQLTPNDPGINTAILKLQSKRIEILSLEKKKYKGFFDKLNQNT